MPEPHFARQAALGAASNGDASSSPSSMQMVPPVASAGVLSQPAPLAPSTTPTIAATPKPNQPTVETPTAESSNKADPSTNAVPTKIAAPIPNQVSIDNATAHDAEPAKPLRNTSTAGLLAGWVAVDSGSLPALTPAFGGAVGLLHGPLRVEVALGWWWPRDASIDRGSAAAAGGRFGLIAGSISGCFGVWRNRRFALSPCGGFEVARWTGEGNGSLEQKQRTSLWGASIVPGAMGVLGVTRTLALRANIDVPIVFSRPVFRVDKGSAPIEVFGPNRAALRIGAGVELRFH